MIPIISLWIPIVLSSVIVFIASSILHMLLKYHRSDYRKLPNEPALVETLRKDTFAARRVLFSLHGGAVRNEVA